MKRIKFFLISLMISFTALSYADGIETVKENTAATNATTIQGKIFDKTTGEPLVGALVHIEGTSYNVYTDFDGNFSFQNILPGVFNLKVSLVSYKENLIKDIQLSANHTTTLEIAIDN